MPSIWPTCPVCGTDVDEVTRDDDTWMDCPSCGWDSRDAQGSPRDEDMRHSTL